MITRKINEDEKREILSFSYVNEKKDYLQNIQVNDLAKHKKVIFELGTGFGKTFLAIKAIKRCQIKFGGSYIIIVPDLRLKQSWEQDLKGIDNCYVYVVNSFTMKNINIPDDVIMTIFDECHHYANSDSMYFSNAIKIINAKYQCCLSATLNDKQLKYLYTLGFNYRWQIPLEQCLSLDLVIPYNIYNISVSLTEEEKEKYVKIQNDYNNNLYYFENYLALNSINTNLASVLATSLLPNPKIKNKEIKFMGVIYKTNMDLANSISKFLNIPAGVLIYNAKMFQIYRNKRNTLLHNAENKIKLCDEFLNLENVKNNKVVVFTNTKLNAEKIVKLNKKKRRGYYTGNDNKNILQDFFDFNFPHLITIKKVDEGQLDNEVGIGISLSHQSESRRVVQKLGRLIRKDVNNPNKKAIFLNVYVESFDYYGKKYISQDEKWLKKSLEKMKFITYIQDLNEIQF